MNYVYNVMLINPFDHMRMRMREAIVKTCPAKTGPAGPLATAMGSSDYFQLTVHNLDACTKSLFVFICSNS